MARTIHALSLEKDEFVLAIWKITRASRDGECLLLVLSRKTLQIGAAYVATSITSDAGVVGFHELDVKAELEADRDQVALGRAQAFADKCVRMFGARMGTCDRLDLMSGDFDKIAERLAGLGGHFGIARTRP